MAQRCMFDEAEEAAVLMTNLDEGETVGVCGAHSHQFFQTLANQTRPVPYELTPEGVEAAQSAAVEEEVAPPDVSVTQPAEPDPDAESDEDEDLPDSLRFDSAMDPEARVGEDPPRPAKAPRKRSV